jgi:hypothetical protein
MTERRLLLVCRRKRYFSRHVPNNGAERASHMRAPRSAARWSRSDALPSAVLFAGDMRSTYVQARSSRCHINESATARPPRRKFNGKVCRFDHIKYTAPRNHAVLFRSRRQCSAVTQPRAGRRRHAGTQMAQPDGVGGGCALRCSRRRCAARTPYAADAQAAKEFSADERLLRGAT